MTDATLSTTSNAATASFTEIRGGIYDITGELDSSNHVKEDKATGGNVLYADGHAGWRDFGEMKVRWSPGMPAGGPASTAPFHWW